MIYLRKINHLTLQVILKQKTLMDGNVDVVVTDGYTGNMVLKNLEGTAKSIGKMLKETIMSSFKNKLAGAVLKKI